LPCIDKIEFPEQKILFPLFKIFLSLTANFNNEFFFNTKHSSNLINIDLIKGYFGLIFLSLFSIEFIVCSGIFEILTILELLVFF